MQIKYRINVNSYLMEPMRETAIMDDRKIF